MLSPHSRAALQALLVSFLWSTSWVFIKFGLDDIPALTFAGLRYMLAWLCLLPVAARAGALGHLRTLPRRDWVRLIALGLVYYSVTQGTVFLGLDRLPAATNSLLLSFSPVVVGLLGIAFLAERLNRVQVGGIGLYLVGVLVYFYPVVIPADQVVGIGIVLVGVLANSVAAIQGRDINRGGRLSPLLVTVTSMGIGAVVLLIAGIAVQGLPAFGLQGWAIVAWLAVVNTAFAFTLWNHVQRTLPAVEASILNNTMLIQIAILAWIFLGESLSPRAIGGLTLAAVGTLIVQVKRNS